MIFYTWPYSEKNRKITVSGLVSVPFQLVSSTDHPPLLPDQSSYASDVDLTCRPNINNTSVTFIKELISTVQLTIDEQQYQPIEISQEFEIAY